MKGEPLTLDHCHQALLDGSTMAIVISAVAEAIRKAQADPVETRRLVKVLHDLTEYWLL